MRFHILPVFCLASAALSIAHAQSLSVTAATAKQVQLTWTGGDAQTTIERRPAGGQYQKLTTVPQGATYTDTAIDAMGIYQYRVKAEGSAKTSNEVTAGAPPVGFTLALRTPRVFIEKEKATNFATSTAMQLDSNSDPAFTYTVVDPEFKDNSDVDHWFLHWDRAKWKWKEPVKVVHAILYRSGTALARDPQTNAWAIAVENGSNTLEIYSSSDDGATWARKHRIHSEETTVLGRAIALSGGQVFLGYRIDANGAFLLSGKLTDDPATWKTETLPKPESLDLGSSSSAMFVAADKQGRPGVVYFLYGPDYNVNAFYWRPGQSTPIKIIDSDNVQNDFHDAVITYADSTTVHVLVELNRKHDGGVDPQMWVLSEKDGKFGPPALLPTDGGHHSMNAPFDLDFDTAGHGATLMSANGGQGDDRCGAPKLSRGSETGPWTTCSPAGAREMAFSTTGYGRNLRFAVNGKLYAGWSTPEQSNKLGTGIILWREK